MNKKLVIAMTFLVMTAAFLLSSPAAHADDFTVTLTTPSQTGYLGSTLDFYGEIDADASNSDTVFLGGDSINLDPSLGTDDSGYLLGAPFSLDPGKSYSGLLFTVTLGPGVIPGNYPGSFTIDGSDINGNDIPATAYFDVSAVPEPSSLFLLAAGATGLIGTWRRKMQ